MPEGTELRTKKRKEKVNKGAVGRAFAGAIFYDASTTDPHLAAGSVLTDVATPQQSVKRVPPDLTLMPPER